MANEKNNKGFLGALQGVVDSAKAAVQDAKLPEVKLPEVKLPDIKIPDVHLPNLFQGNPNNRSVPGKSDEKPSVSVQNALKIIYYMMNVDGTISQDEEQKFGMIGQELDPLFSAAKEQIVSSCRHYLEKAVDPEDYYENLQDGVAEAISAGVSAKEAIISPKLLVWDLLSVAHSDGAYDENERRLLKYIVRRLNVDKAVFLEMESSILTVLDLENELNWIKTTDRRFLQVSTMINEINARKAAVIESVKDLIAF